MLPKEWWRPCRACWEDNLVRAIKVLSQCVYHFWHSSRCAHCFLSDQFGVQDKKLILRDLSHIVQMLLDIKDRYMSSEQVRIQVYLQYCKYCLNPQHMYLSTIYSVETICSCGCKSKKKNRCW